jgi:hypothetical protein
MTPTVTPIDFDQYLESAVADATHAFNFLKESGTLAASLIRGAQTYIPGALALQWKRTKSPSKPRKPGTGNPPRRISLIDLQWQQHEHKTTTSGTQRFFPALWAPPGGLASP